MFLGLLERLLLPGIGAQKNPRTLSGEGAGLSDQPRLGEGSESGEESGGESEGQEQKKTLAG